MMSVIDRPRRLEHPQRVDGATHIMHSNAPDPGLYREDARRHGRRLALRDRPGSAVGTGQEHTKVRLPAGADEHRKAQRDEVVEVGAQPPVVLRSFGEAQPRIQDDLCAIDAGRDGRVRTLVQLIPDLGDDVVVVREIPHPTEWPRQCMSTHGTRRPPQPRPSSIREPA
jgi:hypothetical protein